MRNFIAVQGETVGDVLVYLGTSTDRFTYNGDGIGSFDALDFLYSLHSLARRRAHKNAVFVSFAAQLIIENVLKDLPPELKNILFSSPEVDEQKRHWRRALSRNAYDLRNYKRKLRNLELDAGRGVKPTGFRSVRAAVRFYAKQIAEVTEETAILRAELHKLEYVYYAGYRIRLRPRKSLTIYYVDENGKARKGITLFDLRNFFGSRGLVALSNQFLKSVDSRLYYSRDADSELWTHSATRGEALQRLAEYNQGACETIVKLAQKLDGYLSGAGVDLQRWYGGSAVVNVLFSRWNVRENFRPMTAENTPRLLANAVDCGYFGGRIETTKLGTIQNVYVYDLNSAFAYAASLLPRINNGWRYTRTYNVHEPFALWFVEYELPPDAYLGMLPHREGSGRIVYKRCGRGWYYAPEVRALARRYGDCFNVTQGYVVPYSPVTFGDKIRELYAMRRDLIAREGRGGGEKIFKSILHSISGKFSQAVGEAYYHCLPYAGWITSFVRAQMAEAVAGQESDVIYLHTDAIHSRRPLAMVRVSDELGEWSLKEFPTAVYIGPGLYSGYDEEGHAIKSATRGYEMIDFDDAIRQLNDARGLGRLMLQRDFYVGWKYAREFPLSEREYLKRKTETLTHDPMLTPQRRFTVTETIPVDNAFGRREVELGQTFTGFDWSCEAADSRIHTFDDGRPSAPRRDPAYTTRDAMIMDTLTARM